MSVTPTTRLEDLLDHADWPRRLAGHLAHDPGEADDLMHETWEAALRRPPDDGRPPRPWLAEVVRNLVRLRARKRRLQRRFAAQACAEPPSVPSPELLLERAEAHRRVAELVIGLDEPYRQTLLLRYHEGLSGAQIASALGIPPGTVRWRLKVGLDRVRAGLRAGEDEAWTLALLPVARRPWKGALLMGAKTKAAGAVLVVAILIAALGGRGPLRARLTGSQHPAASPGRPRVPVWARVGDKERPVAPSVGGAAPGRSLVQVSGQVSDAGGGPVPGASLRALALGAGRRPAGGATSVVTSDGRGLYVLHLARGSYRLVADGDGYVPSAVDVVLDGDQRRDFRLLPAARISGRVIERGAGPAGGALVALRSDAIIRAEERTAVADQDGAFAFTGVPPGSFSLAARCGRLVSRTATKVTVPIAASVSDLVVELVPGQVVAGKVVDRRRAAVAGARVDLDGDRGSVSSADGRYRVEGVASGRHVLRAEASGHAPAEVAVAIDGADRDGVELVLPAQSTITGRVIGRDGAAIADAEVSALVTHGDALGEVVASAAQGRSDPLGRFRLTGLGAGDLRVEAEHPDHGRGLAGPWPLEEGSTRAVDVRLGAGGMVRGAVRWGDGAPAAGVIVEGYQLGRPGATTATDARGRYQIGPFPGGDVELAARPEIDPLGRSGGKVRVSVGSGEDRDGVDLVLPRHDREISGVVLAPDGSPSPGATVGAAADHRGVSWRPYNRYARDEGGNYTVLSDADGAFTVKHLPEGTFTVWATQPGFPEGDAFGVAAGSGGVRIALTEGGTLDGRVVARAGTPVAAYTIYATLSRTNDATPALIAARGYVQAAEPIQDPAGRFTLTGLHPAVYDLLVTTPGRLGGRLDSIVLGPGARKDDLQVTVGELVRVKGRAVDAGDRHPLADVVVVGWLAMLREQVSARSDAAGAFVLDGVVPGTIDLSFRGPPGSRRTAQTSIRVPDGSRELDAGDFPVK